MQLNLITHVMNLLHQISCEQIINIEQFYPKYDLYGPIMAKKMESKDVIVKS